MVIFLNNIFDIVLIFFLINYFIILFIELFSNDDISGEALFKFQTPSKRNAMTQKAHLCRTSININTLPTVKIVLERIDLNYKKQLKTFKKCQEVSKGMII